MQIMEPLLHTEAEFDEDLMDFLTMTNESYSVSKP